MMKTMKKAFEQCRKRCFWVHLDANTGSVDCLRTGNPMKLGQFCLTGKPDLVGISNSTGMSSYKLCFCEGYTNSAGKEE